MTNPNQQIQDDSIRLIVIVYGDIYTLVWVTNPVPPPAVGTEEADLYQPTGWYYDEEDIPFFCGATAQAAAYNIRRESGNGEDPLGNHYGKNV